MSTTTTRDVAVEELSKYGFKSNNVYVNWGKQCTEADKGRVVPGGVYLMEVYTADSGKEYVNKVMGQETSASKTVKSVKPVVAKKAAVPPVIFPLTSPPVLSKVEPISTGLSKNEWADKDRRISRQGCIQVAVQVTGTFEEAVELADKMLAFVNQKETH